MIDNKLKARSKDIIDHAEKRLAQFKLFKPAVDRLAYTSILFYNGEQWVTFDTQLLTFRRTNQRRIIPRPTTNKFAPTMNATISALSRFDPKIVIAPQTDTYEDLQTSAGANRVIKTVENEVGFEKRKTEMLPWLTLTGNVFLVTGYDPQAGPKVEKIHVMCSVCGFTGQRDATDQGADCPECALDGLKIPLDDVVDQRSGQPKTSLEATGAMAVDVASVFEMFLDYRIPELQRHQSIGRIHTKDLEWAKHQWPEIADEIQHGRREELNVRIMNALAAFGSPGVEQPSENTVDVVEFWEKPSEKFKDGFYLRYSGQGLIHDLMPYPYMTARGEPFFNIVHIPYDKRPGSLLGRTPAFDLIEKQRTRNRVEAIGEMILMRMSNPVWLVPTPGTQGEITGHVGQKIPYDPHQTDGAKPERVEGAMMSPAIVNWLDRIDRDFAEISAQFEVARGERPLAVRSAAAIDRLKELSSDRATGVFTNFAIGISEWQQQAFEIFRKVAPPERYFRILGDEAAWTVGKIQEADLKGGVDIWAEPGASTPKTHLERLATLELLMERGVVNPADPLVQMRILREYGMAGMSPELDADDQYIAREHDRFKRGGQIAVSPLDNHMLHLQRHLDFWKSEMFETFDREQKQMFIQHIIQHQMAIAQQQQQQQPVQSPQEEQREPVQSAQEEGQEQPMM